MTAAEPEVRLASSLPIEKAHSIYARIGRVHVGSFLDDVAARRARRCLAHEIDWQLHFNEGERVCDLSPQQVAGLGSKDWSGLLGAIHRNAARGFQYLFDNFPLSDEHGRGRYLDLYVMRVYEFVNSPSFLDFAQRLTGVEVITLADALATRYRPGHFLTSYDDAVEGKRRVAAWVLNLTPEWQAKFERFCSLLTATVTWPRATRRASMRLMFLGFQSNTRSVAWYHLPRSPASA